MAVHSSWLVQVVVQSPPEGPPSAEKASVGETHVRLPLHGWSSSQALPSAPSTTPEPGSGVTDGPPPSGNVEPPPSPEPAPLEAPPPLRPPVVSLLLPPAELPPPQSHGKNSVPSRLHAVSRSGQSTHARVAPGEQVAPSRGLLLDEPQLQRPIPEAMATTRAAPNARSQRMGRF